MPFSVSPLSPTIGMIGLGMAHFKVRVTEEGLIYGGCGSSFEGEKFTLPTCFCGKPAGCFANLRKSPPKNVRWVVKVAQGGVKWGALAIEGAS